MKVSFRPDYSFPANIFQYNARKLRVVVTAVIKVEVANPAHLLFSF